MRAIVNTEAELESELRKFTDFARAEIKFHSTCYRFQVSIKIKEFNSNLVDILRNSIQGILTINVYPLTHRYLKVIFNIR